MKFLRFLTLVSCLLYCFMYPAYSQDPYVVYPKPMRYQKTDGQLLTDATIVYKGVKKDFTIELNGKKISYKVDGLDSLRVKLPLIGSKGNLVFKLQGQTISSLSFHPYISDDWSYFKNGTVDIISSSHQDIAWVDGIDYCRNDRIKTIIKPAMEIMKKHPTFKFGMEQTLNLMELLDQDPGYRDIAIATNNRKQFGWGATFNQPYEGVESSEQLVRQLYLGRKWLLDSFNGQMDTRTAFSVDVPARTMQFPQILSKAGVKHLYISRFREGFYNWYSPDGSKVFTYSPANYGAVYLIYKYFDQDAPTAMQKLHNVLKNWNEYYSSRNIPPHYAVVIMSDASGPQFYESVLKDWNDIVEVSGAAIPKLQYTTADQFLSSVNVPGAKIDSISGDRPNLWLYILGSSHYEAFKAKRASSVDLPASEMFNSISGLLDKNFSNYPKKKLDLAWYKSIYPDHGWGGKEGAATDSTFRTYLEESDSLALQTLYPALSKIASQIKTKKGTAFTVFNDLSWNRDAPAKIPVQDAPGEYTLTDSRGKVIPSQLVRAKNSATLQFTAKDVPAIGYNTYYLSKAPKNAPRKYAGQTNACENDFYKIEFGNGGIKSLYDKQLNQELLNTTRFSGGDVLDLGYNGLDAGEFTEITPANMTHYDKFSNHFSIWKVICDGPVFVTYECRYKINEVDFIQRITVYNQIKKIDFEYEVPSWKGIKMRQLSFVMPINSNRAEISYDIPMGMATVHQTELPVRPGGFAWDGTYWQKPEEIHPRELQNFVTASTEKFGLTLSSQVTMFDWVDPTRDAVTYPVLQAVMLTTNRSCHGEGPWYCQKGRHVFNFSVSSHQPGWKNGFSFGIGNNHPLYTVSAPSNKKGYLPERQSFFRSTAPCSQITAVKKADSSDDIILRIVNMDNQNTNGTLRLFKNARQLHRCSLIEEDETDLKMHGQEIDMPLKKSSIETLKAGF